MRTFFRAVSLLLCALMLAACAASPASAPAAATSPAAPGMETPAAGAEIALIATEQRMASAFGQDIWAAVLGFAGAAGLTCAPYKAEAGDAAAARSTLELAVTGGARVVVCMDAAVSELLLGEAAAYGNVYFILLDLPIAQAVLDLPSPQDAGVPKNVTVLGFRRGDEGWLAGYAALCASLGGAPRVPPPSVPETGEPPAVAVMVPVYAAEAYTAPEGYEDEYVNPAHPSLSAMLLTLESGARVTAYIDRGVALYLRAALAGMEAAAAAQGVEGEDARIRLIPVLVDAPEGVGGLPAETDTELGIIDLRASREEAVGHFSIGTPIVMGVGEQLQKDVRGAAELAGGWCVETGDNPAFGADGGFAGTAVAGVLREGGGELSQLLERWHARGGNISDAGLYQAGVADGALSLVPNEELYTAADAPWSMSRAARELLNSADDDYISSGAYRAMLTEEEYITHRYVIIVSGERGSGHITVECRTHFELWEPNEG